MANKIGVITTGGTIGSILSGRAMAVDPGGDIVRREIDALCKRHGFDVVVKPAFNKNSEDVVAADWCVLINAVRDMIEDGVARIVVTHGTDTLAFSAAALGIVFGGRPVRICLTGSFLALEAENSDGPLNLLSAFEAVASDTMPTGVYCSFRKDADNAVARIYHALDVKPMAFDKPAFDSVEGRSCATYSVEKGLQATGKNSAPAIPTIEPPRHPEHFSVAARQVFYVESYPGLAFDRIDHTRLSLLLVGLYHSGTGHAQLDQGSLLAFMHHKQEDVRVLAASYPSKHMVVPYESTAKLIAAGVDVVKDLPAHVIYVFAVLSLAAGATPGAVVDHLKPWLMTPAQD